VKRIDFDRACDQSEPNRIRVWPVKITPLMYKLQDVTVILDNNWENKHVVFCC